MGEREGRSGAWEVGPAGGLADRCSCRRHLRGSRLRGGRNVERSTAEPREAARALASSPEPRAPGERSPRLAPADPGTRCRQEGSRRPASCERADLPGESFPRGWELARGPAAAAERVPPEVPSREENLDIPERRRYPLKEVGISRAALSLQRQELLHCRQSNLNPWNLASRNVGSVLLQTPASQDKLGQ